MDARFSRDVLLQVLDATSRASSIRSEDLLGSRRKQKFCRARWAGWWLLREFGHTHSEISAFFGRSHTASVHGVRKFEHALKRGEWWAVALQDKLLEESGELRRDYEEEVDVSSKEQNYRIMNEALLDKLSSVERERDMHFEARQKIGMLYNKKRDCIQEARVLILQAIKDVGENPLLLAALKALD